MSHSINLQEINPDGAVSEAREAAIDGLPEGDTRLSFLRKSALAGGTALSAGALLGAFAPSALAGKGGYGRPPVAGFGPGDIGILNYALTLEYLEKAFYVGASAANLRLMPQAKAFLSAVTQDETEHVAFLKRELGSSAAREPKFNFKGTNTNAEMFMKTSQVLENTGVHAYSGQALNLKKAANVKAALSILTVEARHASVIGLLNEGAAPTGREIVPQGAFDTPQTAAQVLTAVKGTHFILKPRR